MDFDGCLFVYLLNVIILSCLVILSTTEELTTFGEMLLLLSSGFAIIGAIIISKKLTNATVSLRIKITPCITRRVSR